VHIIVRSVVAVVAGYAAMAAVVILLSVLVKKIAPAWMGAESAPNASYVYTNLLYSFGAAMIGGYVAATIGSRAPLSHACALAVLVFILAIVTAVQIGDRQPRSYQVALTLIGPLGAILGGWVKAHT
jgi:hypothetical protein